MEYDMSPFEDQINQMRAATAEALSRATTYNELSTYSAGLGGTVAWAASGVAVAAVTERNNPEYAMLPEVGIALGVAGIALSALAIGLRLKARSIYRQYTER